MSYVCNELLSNAAKKFAIRIYLLLVLFNSVVQPLSFPITQNFYSLGCNKYSEYSVFDCVVNLFANT